MMMKILLVILLLALTIAPNVRAQKDSPVGMRMEISESGRDNCSYSLFTYKDEDGTFGYYLSLGGGNLMLSITSDNSEFSISDFRETCLWLGATADEAFAMLDTLLALYDKEVGTVKEFRGRTTAGADYLTDVNSNTCIVKKKLLGGRRLQFSFVSGRYTCEIYLPKSVVKELRFGLKTHIKLHPKQHR